MPSGNQLGTEWLVPPKSEEAQQSRFGGKMVWKCIRDLQYARRGLALPILSPSMMKLMYHTCSPAAGLEEALFLCAECVEAV